MINELQYQIEHNLFKMNAIIDLMKHYKYEDLDKLYESYDKLYYETLELQNKLNHLC